MEYGILFFIIACVVGLFMTWGVGANDLANIMSTTMGSKAVSVKQAMCIAIVFEIAGAMIGGVHVSGTIRSGIINTSLFAHSPQLLIDGMIAILLASGTWMFIASVIGMPVSITNAIVGALVGFGAIELGLNAVHWKIISVIGITWLVAPIAAGFVSFWLFFIVRTLIFSSEDPAKAGRRFLPFLLFLVGIVLADMTILKGLTGFGIVLTIFWSIAIMLVTALLVTFLGLYICRRIKLSENPKRYQRFEYAENIFAVLMAFTACAMVYAHGSNDVAIAVGPVAAVWSIVQYHGSVAMKDPISHWTLFFGAVGVIVGLFTYGRKVIATVGEGITTLTPSRAFSATLAAAITVIISTSSGIPVSATQTLVGGVLGVGFARGIGALNLTVIRNILLSWVVTIPVAAILAIGYFDIIKVIIH